MEYPLHQKFPVVLDHSHCLGDSQLLLVEVPRQASLALVRDDVRRIIQQGLIPWWLIPSAARFLCGAIVCRHGGHLLNCLIRF